MKKSPEIQKELQAKQNSCIRKAKACKKKGDYLMATFYTNAAKGFDKKLLKEQVGYGN